MGQPRGGADPPDPGGGGGLGISLGLKRTWHGKTVRRGAMEKVAQRLVPLEREKGVRAGGLPQDHRHGVRSILVDPQPTTRRSFGCLVALTTRKKRLGFRRTFNVFGGHKPTNLEHEPQNKHSYNTWTRLTIDTLKPRKVSLSLGGPGRTLSQPRFHYFLHKCLIFFAHCSCFALCWHCLSLSVPKVLAKICCFVRKLMVFSFNLFLFRGVAWGDFIWAAENPSPRTLFGRLYCLEGV